MLSKVHYFLQQMQSVLINTTSAFDYYVSLDSLSIRYLYKIRYVNVLLGGVL